ncbi:Saposin B-type domain-containing protein [Trichostrongylus colubriformis]|uniref:Saposin B-type domain-containing protein n=1 Tax=Trichostrongylus colubriformis TaxID=6319 RepID=A0AAN8FV79_TRICO
MTFRFYVLFALCIYVLADDSNSGITCSFCKAGLATVTATIQSNPDLQGQLGDSISVGCDQVPNELQRKACRLTLDDNFGLFFKNFLQQPGTSVEDFCKNMGYC